MTDEFLCIRYRGTKRKKKSRGINIYDDDFNLIWHAEQPSTQMTRRMRHRSMPNGAYSVQQDPSASPSPRDRGFVDIVMHTFSTANQDNPTAKKHETDYIKKRTKLSSGWSSIRQQLINQGVKNAYPATFTCCHCQTITKEIYRCRDCGPSAYFCKQCCDKHHKLVVLHLPEKWNPELECFIECNNFLIWRRPSKHDCDTTTLTTVVVIDDRGRQHLQGIEICKCQTLPVTLLQYGLWPASPNNPRVAFTWDLMLTLRAIVLEGQISLYGFCMSFQQCRPGLNRSKRHEWIEDLYRIVSWEMVLHFTWIHHNLTHLQFAAIDFPDGTICSACPKDGDKEGRRIAMDGNMNLVRRTKAGHSVRDPLHKGRFFIPQHSVDQFLNQQGEAKGPEDQNCSRFQAGSIIRAKNKTAKLDTTGTFASVCCHDFPCAIFNMRHGERMGYPIYMMKSLKNVDLLMYDLGCQFERYLKRRNIACPATIAVPIFHIYGHKMACQLQYSPRCTSDAGLFDGEGSERLWSYLGKFSRMTKEMTPENREDLIVEALLNYGQKLTTNMGESLARRLERANILTETTEETMRNGLCNLNGVTRADLGQWSAKEKDLAANHKDNDVESWEASYALRLHEYYSQLDDETEDVEGDLDGDIVRVEAALKRIEKKHSVAQRWTRDSAEYRQHLSMACQNERSAKLRQLRDTAVEYNFMVTMKKKYSRGQSLAKRISRQILEASKKLNVALTAYNSIPPHGLPEPSHKLLRSEVTPLDAPIWQHLAPLGSGPEDIHPSTKRKLIDAYHLHERAKEEIAITSRDFARLLRNLNLQEQKLTEAIKCLQLIESRTPYQSGSLAMMVHTRFRLHATENVVVRVHNRISSAGTIDMEMYFQALEDDQRQEGKTGASVGEDDINQVVTALEEEIDSDGLYELEEE